MARDCRRTRTWSSSGTTERYSLYTAVRRMGFPSVSGVLLCGFGSVGAMVRNKRKAVKPECVFLQCRHRQRFSSVGRSGWRRTSLFSFKPPSLHIYVFNARTSSAILTNVLYSSFSCLSLHTHLRSICVFIYLSLKESCVVHVALAVEIDLCTYGSVLRPRTPFARDEST